MQTWPWPSHSNATARNWTRANSLEKGKRNIQSSAGGSEAQLSRRPNANAGSNRRLEFELGAWFEGACGLALGLALNQMRERGLGPFGQIGRASCRERV